MYNGLFYYPCTITWNYNFPELHAHRTCICSIFKFSFVCSTSLVINSFQKFSFVRVFAHAPHGAPKEVDPKGPLGCGIFLTKTLAVDIDPGYNIAGKIFRTHTCLLCLYVYDQNSEFNFLCRSTFLTAWIYSPYFSLASLEPISVSG